MKKTLIHVFIFTLALALLFPALSRATILSTIDVEFDTLMTVNFGNVIVTENSGKLDFDVILNTDTTELGPNADLLYFCFNLQPGFSNVEVTGTDVISYIFEYSNLGVNPKEGFKANGDGYYDVLVDFGSGGAQIVQSTSFTVDATEYLNENAVLSLSEGGSMGGFYFAIHAQSTTWPMTNYTSEWAGASTFDKPGTPVPEPSTMFLLLFSAMGLFCVPQRKCPVSVNNRCQ